MEFGCSVILILHEQTTPLYIKIANLAVQISLLNYTNLFEHGLLVFHVRGLQ